MDALALYLVADRIDGQASLLRARASLLGLQVTTTQWYSSVARAGLARVERAAASLTVAAARLDALAADVRAHAARVAAAP